ncbi:thiamineS protein [Treponema primitia ZAS-2]|uniref:ThiamineS protein n=1 Tax=Treponema primitia (strain ATCC BAA-887 / DSM 12427 / ZAS-2) TaxID=545694 RepID=F5YQC4_TREPZ|nr:MoaD/ThiS family protein [Treponema primitia]AEF86027.1 thiamineS protein [Treponema primitia ZAS-2]
MAVTILIPTALRNFTDRKSEVTTEGSTVGEALRNFTGTYPDIKQHLYQGEELRSFINVFVEETNIKKLQGLDTKIADGGTIMLVPAIAGGTSRG